MWYTQPIDGTKPQVNGAMNPTNKAQIKLPKGITNNNKYAGKRCLPASILFIVIMMKFGEEKNTTTQGCRLRSQKLWKENYYLLKKKNHKSIIR